LGKGSTKKYQLIAKTSFGFEELLAAELESLGAENIQQTTRAVLFDGDQKLMYEANLHSRVALRILKSIGSFPCANEQALYDGVRTIEWTQFLDPDDTLAVDAVVNQSFLTHSLYVAQKTKDGIVDQFRNRLGRRPNVDLAKPSVRVHIHLVKDIASVSLDSSGESLHRRGYRKMQGEAPLNETLAAGMLMLSGWDTQSPLLDLMCGSGTILIEAALLARRIAPGLFRQEFGFERWKDFDDELWTKIVEDARKNILDKPGFRITGVDKSAQIIRDAKENASLARLGGNIDFHTMNFEDYSPDAKSGMIISNPPYGGRISSNDLFQLYKNIGDQLKKKYSGWTAWILTANKEAAKYIGLKPSRKIPLFNGSLECRFLKYELYKGTRKIKEAESEDEA